MVIIADVACPYDLYAGELYKSKTEKYADLVNFVSRTYNCIFLPIIIGLCGFVHHKTLNNLMKLGLSKEEQKDFANIFLLEIYGTKDVL